MTFGHPFAKRILKEIIHKEQIPHAMLFSGPKGVGKSTFANHFVSELFTKRHGQDQRLESGSHPDIRYYLPEGKTLMHPMSQMQELIKQAQIPPFEAAQKFFIIHDAHRMLLSSSNALLKILEEPGEGIHFILLTDHPELMLETILSRTFTVPFSQVSDETMDAFIQSRSELSREERKQIIFSAHGSFQAAIEAMEKKKDGLTPLLVEILLCGIHGAYPDLLAKLKQLDEIIEDRTRIDEVFTRIFYWYRDLNMITHDAPAERLFFYSYQKELRSCLKRNIPSLEKIHHSMKKAKQASLLNVRIRHIIESFFLEHHLQ